MRVLHTSDWHLGKMLYGQKRHHEFSAFLTWLRQTLSEQKVDALLIAGDIFDTNTPGNAAQQLYYRFLADVANTGCRHVVVIGGNHDSPSFLDAPAQLLSALNVHVVGEACDDPADEVICLQHQGRTELIVCAVPYLRERDLRRVDEGESMADKERKVLEGVKAHYQQTADHATMLRDEAEAAYSKNGEATGQADAKAVPIIGMGHLYAAGSDLKEGDGVRDLYVGSLGQVPVSALPSCFDYLALGHLHVPQRVAGRDDWRYSGSPVAMGFGEAGQQKSVVLIEFATDEAPNLSDRQPLTSSIETLPVPVFQPMTRVKGDFDSLQHQLLELAARYPLPDQDTPAEPNSATEAKPDVNAEPEATPAPQAPVRLWLEAEYTGSDYMRDLRTRLAATLEGSAVDLLRVSNPALRHKTLTRQMDEDALQQLTPDEVFKRRLEASDIADDEAVTLTRLHNEILHDLATEDPHADS